MSGFFFLHFFYSDNIFAMRIILEQAMDSDDCALDSTKSQLSNAPKIKSISHPVDDISQNENGAITHFSLFLLVFSI